MQRLERPAAPDEATLAALAHTAGGQGTLVPCIDAKKHEVDAAVYRDGLAVVPEGAYAPEAFASLAAGAVGAGAIAYDAVDFIGERRGDDGIGGLVVEIGHGIGKVDTGAEASGGVAVAIEEGLAVCITHGHAVGIAGEGGEVDRHDFEGGDGAGVGALGGGHGGDDQAAGVGTAG
jgi:hypothetical protein